MEEVVENKEIKEEKTLDVVIADYENKIKELKEQHIKEIKTILSGRNQESSNSKNVGNDENEPKDFFTKEIEKTKEKLKLK